MTDIIATSIDNSVKQLNADYKVKLDIIIFELTTLLNSMYVNMLSDKAFGFGGGFIAGQIESALKILNSIGKGEKN